MSLTCTEIKTEIQISFPNFISGSVLPQQKRSAMGLLSG